MLYKFCRAAVPLSGTFGRHYLFDFRWFNVILLQIINAANLI